RLYQTYWKSRFILLKEWELKAIEAMNLAILSTREPTYWPYGNKEISDLLGFGISKGILKNYCHTESYFELSYDHSPVIITVNDKAITKSKSCTLCNTQTK
ncbi:hypothetical protein HN011_002119, partial [Eciton burchellii]